jgi:probable rRNA maturation factor
MAPPGRLSAPSHPMSAPNVSSSRNVELDVEFAVEEHIPAVWEEARIRQLVASIVERELGPGRYTIALHLVGDETIRELNREHRGVDLHTDVLAFPLHDPNGMRFVVPPDLSTNLGDVVVSHPRVQAQAEEYGHSPGRELAYLVVHGVLHVLGYDHEAEDDRVRMRAREEEALGPFGFTR